MSNTKTYTPFSFTTSFDELEKSDLQVMEEERERAAEEEKERQRLEEEALNAPPPPPTFSEEELAAAKAEAWNEGHTAGHSEALGQIEQQTLTALQTMTGYMAVLQDRQALANESQAAALARIASDMVRKLMPIYASEHGVEEIKNLVYSSLAPLETKGRINITLPEGLHSTIQEQLGKVAQEAGFEGKLMYHPDAKLGPSDVRVDWGRGSAERNVGTALQEMEKIVEQFLENHLNAEEVEAELTVEPGNEDRQNMAETPTTSVPEQSEPVEPPADLNSEQTVTQTEEQLAPTPDVNLEIEQSLPDTAMDSPPEEPDK
ncbi:FliH/SctL family protein [Curvivirga aplysinae]|uniref:FliH/SctL family protein n=1 Tax=Curvivirga aplysinae TaxID=2529852 RepID=UPI0012BC662A|nr:FliH/SctL family protein [Curvivirga aplysinae]MTI08564.1 hypothetical protein [Curvivirga aplysinae]